MVAAETQYPIKFARPGTNFCLSLHYNGGNSFLFDNTTKVHQFKAEDSEIKKYPLCLLGNISGDFSADTMKKNRIKWVCVRLFC